MRKLNKAIDRFCALHPRFGIPGLMRYIVGANLVIYLLSMFAKSGTLNFLALDTSAVFQGEIWRIITYALIPSYSGIWLFFSLLFYYWLGEALERLWGSAKFTIYYVSGVLLTAIAVLLVSLLSRTTYYVAGADYVNSALFFAYAIVNGITMSVIFAVYEMSSIVVLFLAAAALFGGFALYGYNYKGDLTRWGPLLLISLLIAIVMSVINILFLKAQMFEIFIDCFVLFLFFGLTVYDMNKIKRMSMTADGSRKLHVYAAMELYLDFINIFLRLLSLFGKSKN